MLPISRRILRNTNRMRHSAAQNGDMLLWNLSNRQNTGGCAWPIGGFGPDGTMTAGATWGGPIRPGGFGVPFSFDGVDDYIDFGAYAGYVANTISMSCWAYFTSLSNAYTGIMSIGNGGSTIHTMYVKSSGLLAMYGGNGGASYDGTGTYTLVTNRWYHLTLTWDSTNGLSGYVDGCLDGTGAGGSNVALSGAIVYGRDQITGGRFMSGYMDDCRVSNRFPSLRADEVRKLYYASLAGYPEELNWKYRRVGAAAAAGGSSRNLLLLGCGA